jgi:hypothetical protein
VETVGRSPRSRTPDANGDNDRDPDAGSYGYSDANSDANSHADTDPNGHSDADTYSVDRATVGQRKP